MWWAWLGLQPMHGSSSALLSFRGGDLQAEDVTMLAGKLEGMCLCACLSDQQRPQVGIQSHS